MSIFLARKNFDGKDHLASTEEGQEVSVVREVAITLPPTFEFGQQNTSPWQLRLGIVMIVPFLCRPLILSNLRHHQTYLQIC